MAETIAELSLQEIHESPTNPRRDFGDLTELAESIRESGVLQPVLVRPMKDGGYELVYGHRRYMASLQAGLTTIPAMVRELDDQQVLEAQLVENSQRHDVCAVDEGDAIAELHRRFGVPTQEIAARLGRPKKFVLQRLQVARLVDDAKVAVRNGRMHVAVALMLARLPEDQQREALDDLVDGEEPATIADARHLIEKSFMLRLDGAGFDVGDANLIRDAGACTVCPKRSGTQLELLGSLSSPDLCTDAACFGAKKEAGWQKRSAEHRAAGLRVLSDEEGAEYFPHGAGYPMHHKLRAAGLVALDAREWDGEAGEFITAREKLGPDVEVVLVRGKNGDVHELAALPPEKPAAGKKAKPPRPNPELERLQLEDQIREATDVAVGNAIVDKLVADEDDARVWRLLAAAVVDRLGGGRDAEEIARSIGVITQADIENVGKASQWQARHELVDTRLRKAVAEMSPGDHRELMALFLISHGLLKTSPDEGDAFPAIVDAVHAYGIDVEAIEERERKRLTPAPTKAPAKAKASKKGKVAADA